MSRRSDSATSRAAAAVFSHTVTFTPRSSLRYSLHWPSACSCEKISFTSESATPGLASRLCLTHRRMLRAMWKRWLRIRSYTRPTEPLELLSMGRMP